MNIMNSCYSFLTYIFQMIVPVKLCAVHPYTYITSGNMPFWFYLLPLFLAALFALVLISAKKSREYLFGFLFYAVTISVMLKLVPVGDSLVNERYTYISFIGLFFIGGHIYSCYSNNIQWRYLAHGLLISALVVLSILSVQRISTWKNNYTFWEDVTKKYPDYWRGYYGLSVQYYKTGDLDGTFENVNMACQRNPAAAPYAMRGNLYLEKFKNYDLAIADFNKVLSFNEKDSPFNMVAHLNLGIAWSNKGDFARADSEYAKTILLYPDYPLAYIRRGTMYADNLERYDEAVACFLKALILDPNQKEAAMGIGYCYLKKNMTTEAISAFTRIISADNSDGRPYFFRALAFAQAGRYKDAYSDGLKSKQLGFKINEKDLESWKSLWTHRPH